MAAPGGKSGDPIFVGTLGVSGRSGVEFREITGTCGTTSTAVKATGAAAKRVPDPGCKGVGIFESEGRVTGVSITEIGAFSGLAARATASGAPAYRGAGTSGSGGVNSTGSVVTGCTESATSAASSSLSDGLFDRAPTASSTSGCVFHCASNSPACPDDRTETDAATRSGLFPPLSPCGPQSANAPRCRPAAAPRKAMISNPVFTSTPLPA